MISQECKGEAAKLLVEDLKFSNNFEYINTLLNETDEMMSICMLKDNYPAQNYPEIGIAINKLKIEGTSLQLFEIINIRQVLEQAKSLKHFFKLDEKNQYPFLNKIVNQISFPNYLYDRINSVVSKNG